MGDSFHGASVLIVTDDPEFARTVAAHWQTEAHATGVTITSSDVWHASIAFGYHLVVVGPVRTAKSAGILSALCGSPAPAVVYVADSERDAPFLRTQYPQLPVIVRQDNWLNSLVLIAGESLRRVEALGRAQRAERLAQESQQHAALGRYILEMRPGINDALTSMLGNADLMMLDAPSLAPERREQVRAIHTMALRLHQVMQRFSSLAAEMRVGENESQDETAAQSHRVAVRS